MKLLRPFQEILLFVCLLFYCGRLEAQEEHPWAGIANATLFPQKLLDYRDAHGWSDLRISLYQDARYAYEHRLPVAERLLYAFLWVDLMHESEAEYVPQWIESMSQANRLHANIPSQIPFYEGVLGDRLSDEFLRFFFARGDLMRSAYNQWDASDLLTECFSILNRLYTENAYLFAQYANLAFAIAFVHDIPPPPVWPHPQVSLSILPRQLSNPDEVFAYFTNPRNAKYFHGSLKRLDLSEAIFLVDLQVRPEEVEWVRNNVSVSPLEYEKVYEMVSYDVRRLRTGRMTWPYDDYSLPAILQVGGICVDQAYFASQVGKVQGMPTLEFLGLGMDGRHAWFGYLDTRDNWNMDAGRYADQRYITGHAFNPQTWIFISDHDLEFLGAGYHKSQSYFKSQMHFYWARLYRHSGKLEAAEKAAQDAVAVERRNFEAWKLLIEIRKERGLLQNLIDSTYRSALSALRTFSDLEADVISEFADYLEQTGRENQARLERSRITYKNKITRTDLAVENAKKLLENSMREDSPSVQMYVFRRLLYELGSQGGIQVLDDLLIPFVDFLLRKGRPEDARTAVMEAESLLDPAAGSQLARDLIKVKFRVGL